MKPETTFNRMVTLLLLGVLLTACSSDDSSDNGESANGDNGGMAANGNADPNSENGTNGTNGENGSNGEDGTNGMSDVDNALTFSGEGAFDPPSSLSPGTVFIPVTYEETVFETTLLDMTWEDENGTIIGIIPNDQNPSAAGLVSITLDGNVGGTAWLSTDIDGQVDGATVSDDLVTLENVEVNDPTITSTMIIINGSLLRQSP